MRLMKILLTLVALLLLGCGGGDPNSDITYITNVGQPQIKIHLVDQAGMPAEEVQKLLESCNLQLQRDFKPVWGIDAVLVLGDSPNGSGKRLTVLPDFKAYPQANGVASGFHTTGVQAYVDYGYCRQIPHMMSVTTSHEILEMCTNPNVDTTGYEIADPVGPLRWASFLMRLSEEVVHRTVWELSVKGT